MPQGTAIDRLARDLGVAGRGPARLGVKRALDVVLAFAILPIAVLLVLVLAVAIKLDSPGPVFFGQPRTGLHGRRFRMWKLRTMIQGAEQRKLEVMHLNSLRPPDFKIVDDPRITRVGRFLRRTHLDELPQIANVVLGEMSFVGPRPTSFGATTYDLWQTKRLEVRPGITGLWQVSSPKASEFDDRLRLDIRYINEMSLWLDLKILAQTLVASARGTGV
jgi:lipopolysaccharide/colanic/teichoic acid biosynthesis glycosyltransferase